MNSENLKSEKKKKFNYDISHRNFEYLYNQFKNKQLKK